MSEPTFDQLVPIVVAVIVAVPPTIAALYNARKTQQLHVLINSNLAAQIAAQVKAAFAEGQIEGTRLERDR